MSINNVPTTEEQILLVDFKREMLDAHSRFSREQRAHFGPPFIAVWTPQLTTKMEDVRKEWLNDKLSNWAAEWWQKRGYETVRAHDGSVGIKSKAQ